MKIISLQITFILFLFAFGFIKAQEAVKLAQPMTLEACIDYALKNNIQIKQSELTTEISQITLTQSQANLLPELNANASHSYNYGRTIDRFTNEFATQQVLSQNFALNSDVTLFGGLQSINTIRQNKFIYLANRLRQYLMKHHFSFYLYCICLPDR